MVYTFIWGLLIATVLMLPAGLLIGRYAYRTVVAIPKAMLAPTVALLTVIGSFAIHSNVQDAQLMVGLGLIAWVLARYGFAPSPIVLGLVLGQIAEQGFVQTYLIGNASDRTLEMFFGRPISIGIILAALLTLLYPFVAERRTRKKTPAAAAAAPDAARGRDTAGMGLAAGFVLLGILIFLGARGMSAVGSIFPTTIAVGLILFSLLPDRAGAEGPHRIGAAPRGGERRQPPPSGPRPRHGAVGGPPAGPGLHRHEPRGLPRHHDRGRLRPARPPDLGGLDPLGRGHRARLLVAHGPRPAAADAFRHPVLNRRLDMDIRTHRIAAIPGDGIGIEVVAAGLEVLEALADRDGGFRFDVESFDWGTDRYRRTGAFMPEDGADRLRGFDAILFGAVGAPDVADHLTLWGLRLAICQPLDQYANVRPTRMLPGIRSPLRHVGESELDWVIVRENSEGEYAGQGGRSHPGLPLEVATDVSIFTRAGVERIMRFAFRLAQSRPRKLPDRGDQIQRAAARHGALGPDRGRGRARVPRTCAGTRCWSMP